jgi:hypothetical protein
MLDYGRSWLPTMWQILVVLQRIWTLTSSLAYHFLHYKFILSSSLFSKNSRSMPSWKFWCLKCIFVILPMINKYVVFSLVVHANQTCYNLFCMNHQTCMTNSINNMLEVCCNMYKPCYKFYSLSVSLDFVFMGL